MHSQRHLRLLAISTERAFADEQSDDDAALEVTQGWHGLGCTARSGCFTVKKNVKRQQP
jgi:hypothetical protein